MISGTEVLSKSSLDAEHTASYDSLARLSTLDACIQDALSTQAKLTSQIASLVKDSKSSFSEPTELRVAQNKHQQVQKAFITTQKQTEALRRNIASSRASIEGRRRTITDGHRLHSQIQDDCTARRHDLQSQMKSHEQTTESVHGQRRRLCTDLSTIYTIEPSSGKRTINPLSFAVRNIHVPNSTFTSESLSASAICAGLGYTAHAVSLLSLYLSVPLPYSIHPSSSSSTIHDAISLLPPSQSREFPLFLNARNDNMSSASGSAAFGRFEYAVFLLNKDIEALAARLDVRVLDIRQTLPNLKYVLLVATAGKGEVPKRLVGGTRRMLAGDHVGTSAQSSRRGSEESGGGEAGRVADEVRRRLGALRGREGDPSKGK